MAKTTKNGKSENSHRKEGGRRPKKMEPFVKSKDRL